MRELECGQYLQTYLRLVNTTQIESMCTDCLSLVLRQTVILEPCLCDNSDKLQYSPTSHFSGTNCPILQWSVVSELASVQCIHHTDGTL